MTDQTQETPLNFETSLAELGQLVDTLEQGGLSLEDALKHFERGITLTRTCQKALADAEQQVNILVGQQENGTVDTEPFTPEEK